MDKYESRDSTTRAIANGIRGAGRYVRSRITRGILRKAIVSIAALAAPLLVPLLVVVLCYLFIHFSVFWLPKYIYENRADGAQDTKIIYYTGEFDAENWSIEDDVALYERYEDIQQTWLDTFKSTEELHNEYPKVCEEDNGEDDSPKGYHEERKCSRKVGQIWNSYIVGFDGVPSEQAMVLPYMTPWALLGSTDKVLGDPIMHGAHGPEKEGRGRIPVPEQTFKALEPDIEWDTFNLYFHEHIVSCGEDGCTSTTYHYEHVIPLLSVIDNFEANFEYTWDEEVHEESISYPDGGSYYLKVVTPKISGIKQTGNPYEYARLHGYLTDEGLSSFDDTELALNLAWFLDDNFRYNSYMAGMATSFQEGKGLVYMGAVDGRTWPCNGVITSPFSDGRLHPVHGVVRPHLGIDIGNDMNTPIYAVANGMVSQVVSHAGEAGNFIAINHGNFTTRYLHLNSMLVEVGQDVSVGEKIALMGNTGVGTGPHLHFEVIVNGTHVDPLTWLPPR